MTSPSSVTPIGTMRRLRCGVRVRHSACTSKVIASRMPSSVVSSKLVSSGSSETSRVPLVRFGAMIRASASHWVSSSPSRLAVPVVAPAGNSTTSSVTVSRSTLGPPGIAPVRSSSTTLRMPAPSRRELSGRSTRCATITRNGSLVVGFTARSWSPRSVISGPSMSISASWLPANIRTGPAASYAVGCALCGSHLTHSQGPRCTSAASTAIRSSSGAWKVASCATMARARSMAGSMAPSNSTLVKLGRPTEVGMPDTVRYASEKRRSEIDDSGSRSSIGLVDGGLNLQHRGLPAETDADPAEVVVAGPPLPQPAAHRDRPQPARLRVVPQDVPALLVGRVAGLLAQLPDVAQEVAPLAAHLALALGGRPADLHDAHEQHAAGHRAAHHVHDRGAVVEAEHGEHRAHAEAHRHDHREGAEVERGLLGHQRRLLELDRALRRLGTGGAGRALDGDRTHPSFPTPVSSPPQAVFSWRSSFTAYRSLR